MPDAPGGEGAGRPAVYSIPPHRSFADALAVGLIRRFGREPMALAHGRILLANNRAVRTMTEAFVRASEPGLVLPRLIAIGDPEIDDRMGGALDPIALAADTPPAIDPLTRQLMLAKILLPGIEGGSGEALRLAADLARALDALTVEEIEPSRLIEAVSADEEMAGHWRKASAQLAAVAAHWPAMLEERGAIDLAERRNRLLHGLAERWRRSPPGGFTVAAGITTAAPAVVDLLSVVARMEGGMVVLPGLASEAAMPAAEWEALGPDADGRGQETHPQYHLKHLLNRVGVARAEVEPWPAAGRTGAPAVRGRAVAHAMTAADFSDKWSALSPPERRLSGVRCALFGDSASEAQAIALAMREALETPERTAALVTPDRTLAERVAAHLRRWSIDVDDSAGQPLSQRPAGTLLLALAGTAAEGLAPIALLALLKHPRVGGEGEARRGWLEQVRRLDLALRGPRPPEGLAGLERRIGEKIEKMEGLAEAWGALRPHVVGLDAALAGAGDLASLARSLREGADLLAGEAAWSGPDGRAAAELLADIEADPAAAALPLARGEWIAVLRDLLAARAVRRPYGGHPRLFIWGLLEARLQQADLMILGGLNEGNWPSIPSPDPWLAPRIRRELRLPGLEFRTGLAAHDFASALGASRVLLTRARREGRSPTVPSRFWLRVQAMTGGLARDHRLERWASALDAGGVPTPVARPAPAPPAERRPKRIAVTDLDRLKADPFAYYAKAVLNLRTLDPLEMEQDAAWRGTAVHAVLQQWFEQDDCAPDLLVPRVEALVRDPTIHPMLRALWQPRLIEAAEFIARQVAEARAEGRFPVAVEKSGETELGGVTVHGRLDRADRLADGALGIIDYKTGKAPKADAVAGGFAMQLGLLAAIAERGGFPGLNGKVEAVEYWSLAKDRDGFGKISAADAKVEADDFTAWSIAQFEALAADYLTGLAPFEAKLHPAYAPYEDYDQLMRLEEWYGRGDD